MAGYTRQSFDDSLDEYVERFGTSSHKLQWEQLREQQLEGFSVTRLMDIVLRDIASVSGTPMPLQLVDTSGSTPLGEGAFRPTASDKKQKGKTSQKHRDIDSEESEDEDDDDDQQETQQINRSSSSRNLAGLSQLRLRLSTSNSTANLDSDVENTESADANEESEESDSSEGTSDDEDEFEVSAGEEDQESHSEFEDGGRNAKVKKSARRRSQIRRGKTILPPMYTSTTTLALGTTVQTQASTAPPPQPPSTNTGVQASGRPVYTTVRQWAAALGVDSVRDLNRFVAPFLVSAGLPAWEGDPARWFTVGRHLGDRELNNMIWDYIRAELAAGR